MSIEQIIKPVTGWLTSRACRLGKCMMAIALVALPGPLASNAATGPAQAIAPVPHPQSASSSKFIINPHLHMVPVKRVPELPSHVHHIDIKAAPVVHVWRHQWDYNAWFALHRGLGTIHGTVVDKAGHPVINAAVALRGAKGRIFRNINAKHRTTTSSTGTFTMTSVRSGRYRVRAQFARKAGHSAVEVHAGDIVVTSVRL